MAIFFTPFPTLLKALLIVYGEGGEEEVRYITEGRRKNSLASLDEHGESSSRSLESKYTSRIRGEEGSQYRKKIWPKDVIYVD